MRQWRGGGAVGRDRGSRFFPENQGHNGAWEKQNKSLASDGIPTRYTTTSRLCILSNEFPKVTKNVQSVLDRAKTVIFDPPVQEVHEYVRGWWSKENKDIFDYIGDNLKRIGRPSIRWYTDMLREKRLGNNWRGWLVSQWHEDNPLLAEVGEILNSDLIGEARIAEWKERTGMSRPSFFIYQRQWNDAQGNR